MLDMLDLYLANVEEQVQSINTDGQYVHLNIKKHFQDIKKGSKIGQNGFPSPGTWHTSLLWVQRMQPKTIRMDLRRQEVCPKCLI